ncbi:MAG: hypothetical protein Q9182_002677 [Xanthomendoza sp. 2 TL-2023]
MLNDATALKPSVVWLTRSRLSVQLRTRFSRASALVRSFPIFSPPRIEPTKSPRKSPPASAGLGSTAATTPPPPYLELAVKPTTIPITPEQDAFDTKYARQGLSLLQTSLHEHSQNPSFARQLYIHALVYLLQGLPSLSQSDTLSLRSALPHSLFLPTSSKDNDNKSDNDEEEKYQTDTNPAKEPHKTPPSFLHRALSTTVFLSIIFIHFLSPYLHSLLSTLKSYDHEYRIQQRTCNFCFSVARRVSEVLISTVDPQYLIWLAAEIATGVGDGWRRGVEGTGIYK